MSSVSSPQEGVAGAPREGRAPSAQGQLDKLSFQGLCYCVGLIAHPQLLEDMAQFPFYGAFAHKELAGDPPGGHAGGDQA